MYRCILWLLIPLAENGFVELLGLLHLAFGTFWAMAVFANSMVNTPSITSTALSAPALILCHCRVLLDLLYQPYVLIIYPI